MTADVMSHGWLYAATWLKKVNLGVIDGKCQYMYYCWINEGLGKTGPKVSLGFHCNLHLSFKTCFYMSLVMLLVKSWTRNLNQNNFLPVDWRQKKVEVLCLSLTCCTIYFHIYSSGIMWTWQMSFFLSISWINEKMASLKIPKIQKVQNETFTDSVTVL